MWKRLIKAARQAVKWNEWHRSCMASHPMTAAGTRSIREESEASMMNSNASHRSESDKLKIAIKEEQLTVAPETRATLTVGLGNNNPYEDDIDLVVRGVPPEWVTIPTRGVHLAPGEAKLVTLTVRPAAMPDNRVAQFTLDVRAISQRNPEQSAAARSVLTVAAY